MNISSISNALLPMMYQNVARKTQPAENVDFSDALGSVQKSDSQAETYTAHLKDKYGFNIRVESIGRDQESLDKIAKTMHGNDLVIGPKILEKMASERRLPQRLKDI